MSKSEEAPLEVALISGQAVRYRVRRSDRARRLTIQVSRRDGLVVILPRSTPRAEVARMIDESADWIDRQVRRHGVRNGPVRREYATGSVLHILGWPRTLVLEPLTGGRKRQRNELADDRLTIKVPPTTLLDPRPALEKYLRQLARSVLTERVDELAKRIGLRPARIIVGERTSRWGSCSPLGTLSFCYRLVMAPLPVVDAVVAHEICHLRHLNHGRKFYRLLDLACPDHREHMGWLRRHEDDLQL